MKTKTLFPLLVLLALGNVIGKEPAQSTVTRSETKPHEPKAGTAERKAILDALRQPVDKVKKDMLKDSPKEQAQTLVFTVETLSVLENWAYVVVSYTPDFAEGVATAVLHRENDEWKVKDLSFADDVPAYSSLAERLKAPRAIFPKDVEKN